jgi:uncharacterized protein (DUF433 family)
MTEKTDSNTTIVRTDRGLSIAGTRITLYNIMDCLKAGWPSKLIRDRLDLTDKQISDALEYIGIHRDEIEAEYQSLLKQAEEIRQYWENYNRERFDRIAAKHPKPGQEEIFAKLKAWEKKLGLI